MVLQYRLDVVCDDCGQVHEMSMHFMLAEGPPAAGSLEALFSDGELPPQVELFAGTPVECPQTERVYVPEDRARILLVPQVGSRY